MVWLFVAHIFVREWLARGSCCESKPGHGAAQGGCRFVKSHRLSFVTGYRPLNSASSGKKKKQKKQKSNKTQSLNDFLARPSVGSKYSSKDPPKRTDSWADAMDERGDAEGRQVKGATGELVKVFFSLPARGFHNLAGRRGV